MNPFTWFLSLFRKETSGSTGGAVSSPVSAAAQPSRLMITPFDIAKRYLGTKEIPGPKSNSRILAWLRRVVAAVKSEDTSWCSAFANNCAEESGYERTGSLVARSWLNVGEKIPLEQARPGDVIILWRVSPSSWEGHVAFLDHYAAKRGLVYLLGGNQGNEVNITAFPASRVIGVRRLRPLDRLQGNSSRQL